MAATEIIVRFLSVFVAANANHAEWSFTATVKRLPANTTDTVGDPTHEFEVSKNDIVPLPLWNLGVKIKPEDKQIDIRLKGVSSGLVADTDLGDVRATLNLPILHGYDIWLKSSLNTFNARIIVKVTKDSEVPAGSVTTVVAHQGSSGYNTVQDGMQDKMVHICPVVPVPWTTGIPPIARGVQSLTATDQDYLGIPAGTTKLNALVNPSLIPAVPLSHSDFNNICARIRITQHRPRNLDLSKLIWKAATDNVRLVEGGAGKAEIKGGREVKAVGVLKGNADEECRIEVRWDEPGQPLLAVYRAWVGKPKYVWTRANIVKCSAGNVGGVPVKNTRSTKDNVKAQIAYNNVFLWQSGILMTLDNDKTAYNGAVLKERGIFEVTTAQNYSFNIANNSSSVAPLLNQRGRVFNIAYIHSVAGKPDLLGRATDRRLSADADGEAKRGGNPSVSWVRPTGVYPDDAGKQVKMKTMGKSDKRDDAQKPLAGDQDIDSLCAVLMTDLCNDSPDDTTLVHELGHVLGLHHRGCGGNQTVGSYDGVNHLAGPRSGRGHPWDENVMTYGPNRLTQDFDLLQTEVMRKHALLRDRRPPPPLPPKPPPVPPPKEKKPVPAAGLPTEQDRILLQEYLSGKRKGLKNTGYVIGNSGPAGDGVDGVVGPKTKAAIRSFQKDHGGLWTDGIYGPKTRAAFEQELNG